MNEYLITDRIKRELETIQFLFEMQLGKDFNEAQNVFLMPGELATEPRFILNFGFLLTKSDEMFDFETFKSQIRERYETAMDKGGLIKELNEIAEKCREIISLNDELNNSGIKKLTSSLKEHNAIVEIYNYDISIVYLGLSYSEYWDKDNKAFFPADNCLFLDYVDEVLAFINGLQSEAVKPDEVYKTQLLFKVGLLFANGEMNKYFTVNGKGKLAMKEGYKAPIIAKELGNDNFNKYILATINEYALDNPNGGKNIFNRPEMMKKIISHCEAEKIAVDNYFKSRLPTE